MDPLILHVCCDTLDDCDALLKCAKTAGLKRSGIVQVKPRFMVEIMGVDNVGTPILSDIEDKQLETLVAIANTRMDKNLKKLEIFTNEITIM